MLNTKFLNKIVGLCNNLQQDAYTAQIISEPGDLEQVYRLRYKAYNKENYIQDLPNTELRDQYDDPEISKIIVIRKYNEIIATVRVCLQKLPVQEVFPEELSAYRGKNLAEITKLVSDDRGIVFMLFKMVSYILQDNNIDYVFIAVCHGHIKFYEYMGFKRISSPKLWPELNHVYGQLLMCTSTTNQELLHQLPKSLYPDINSEIASKFLTGEEIPLFT